VGLERLTDKLKEAAQLRLEHPELTLSQLAELCCPPVTKSSITTGCKIDGHGRQTRLRRGLWHFNHEEVYHVLCSSPCP
jgi:hypothetical protein